VYESNDFFTIKLTLLSVKQSFEVLYIQHRSPQMTLIYILKYLFVDIYKDSRINY